MHAQCTPKAPLSPTTQSGLSLESHTQLSVGRATCRECAQCERERCEEGHPAPMVRASPSHYPAAAHQVASLLVQRNDHKVRVAPGQQLVVQLKQLRGAVLDKEQPDSWRTSVWRASCCTPKKPHQVLPDGQVLCVVLEDGHHELLLVADGLQHLLELIAVPDVAHPLL